MVRRAHQRPATMQLAIVASVFLWATAAVAVVVNVPDALDATVCDTLAAEARSIVGADGRGQLEVSPQTAEMFVKLGLTTSLVHEVNVRIEADVDRWGVHVDRPLPGTPAEFEQTSIIYLTESAGGLTFPDENVSVPFAKGSLVTFPAGVRHGVSEGSGARVMLGPFSETMTEVGANLGEVGETNVDLIWYDDQLEDLMPAISFTFTNYAVAGFTFIGCTTSQDCKHNGFCYYKFLLEDNARILRPLRKNPTNDADLLQNAGQGSLATYQTTSLIMATEMHAAGATPFAQDELEGICIPHALISVSIVETAGNDFVAEVGVQAGADINVIGSYDDIEQAGGAFRIMLGKPCFNSNQCCYERDCSDRLCNSDKKCVVSAESSGAASLLSAGTTMGVVALLAL